MEDMSSLVSWALIQGDQMADMGMTIVYMLLIPLTQSLTRRMRYPFLQVTL